MSDTATRKPLLKDIESQRECRALLYVTGDRPGLETRIGQDVVDLFVDHLDAIGPVPKISLILYTNGGDTSAAWNLVNLIRMFCDEFEVIVPSKCRSAGTLVCLGADRIVMTKQATLGPVDPSVVHPLAPVFPDASGEERAPVSVEAVDGYLGAVERYGGKKVAAQALLDLANKVHPLVLGQIFRSRKQIRDLARRLLEKRLDDDGTIDKIVEFLCSESGSHDYTINRREATGLGLPVERCSPELYKTINSISNSYSRQMEFRNTYSLGAQLLPMARQLHKRTEGQPIKYEHTLSTIESLARPAHAFIVKGIVEITLSKDQAATHEHHHFVGWKELADET